MHVTTINKKRRPLIGKKANWDWMEEKEGVKMISLHCNFKCKINFKIESKTVILETLLILEGIVLWEINKTQTNNKYHMPLYMRNLQREEPFVFWIFTPLSTFLSSPCLLTFLPCLFFPLPLFACPVIHLFLSVILFICCVCSL